jgi:hypothetical protein
VGSGMGNRMKLWLVYFATVCLITAAGLFSYDLPIPGVIFLVLGFGLLTWFGAKENNDY